MYSSVALSTHTLYCNHDHYPCLEFSHHFILRLRKCAWVGRMPWRRKWQSAVVFLPGKSHWQRSLVGYSPWGYKRVRHDLVSRQQQHHGIKSSGGISLRLILLETTRKITSRFSNLLSFFLRSTKQIQHTNSGNVMS